MKNNWKFYGPNYVLKKKGFAISYNPGVYLCPGFASDDGGPETAVAVDGKHYILNGDYRKQYEELVGRGLKSVLDFFRKQPQEKVSSWSNKLS